MGTAEHFPTIVRIKGRIQKGMCVVGTLIKSMCLKGNMKKQEQLFQGAEMMNSLYIIKMLDNFNLNSNDINFLS